METLPTFATIMPVNHSANSPTVWKDLHPGNLTISKSVINSVLTNVGLDKTPRHHTVRHTYDSDAMDQCVRNLMEENIITRSPGTLPPTMSLFLKPKDEHSARVICDLRPLNGRYEIGPAPLYSTINFWSGIYYPLVA